MPTRKSKRTYGAQFKARAALAAIRGGKTLTEIAAEFEVHPNLITQWKWLLLEHAEEVFEIPRPGQTLAAGAMAPRTKAA